MQVTEVRAVDGVNNNAPTQTWHSMQPDIQWQTVIIRHDTIRMETDYFLICE